MTPEQGTELINIDIGQFCPLLRVVDCYKINRVSGNCVMRFAKKSNLEIQGRKAWKKSILFQKIKRNMQR